MSAQSASLKEFIDLSIYPLLGCGRLVRLTLLSSLLDCQSSIHFLPKQIIHFGFKEGSKILITASVVDIVFEFADAVLASSSSAFSLP